MRSLIVVGSLLLATLVAAAPQNPEAAKPSQDEEAPEPPKINWGKCPQLQPSDNDKTEKQNVIDKCLQQVPPPTETPVTKEAIDAHREEIATCALRLEGWFDDGNKYKYDKAESEIKQKKLDGAIEGKILEKHATCKGEAETTFADAKDTIKQVQLYQACMDFHISNICEIEVIAPSGEVAVGQDQQ